MPENWGVLFSSVNRWEDGRSKPNMIAMKKLKDFCETHDLDFSRLEKAWNIDTILFNCRDILHEARNSGSFFEKRDMMLTLVFLRFIGEKYEDGFEKLRQTLLDQGPDPDDENIHAAFEGDSEAQIAEVDREIKEKQRH